LIDIKGGNDEAEPSLVIGALLVPIADLIKAPTIIAEGEASKAALTEQVSRGCTAKCLVHSFVHSFIQLFVLIGTSHAACIFLLILTTFPTNEGGVPRGSDG
jgi:hypothetical protein